MLYRRLGVTALLLSMLVRAAPAGASEQEAEKKAKVHFEQAVALFQEEKYDMALAEFLKSYELKPNWKLRLTISMCYFNVDRFVEAREEVRAYLEEGGDEIPGEKLAEAQELLGQLSKLVAEVTVTTNVPGSKITVNGKDVFKTPLSQPIAVVSGFHTIRVEAEGYEPVVEEINVAGGDSKLVSVILEEKPRSPSALDEEAQAALVQEAIARQEQKAKYTKQYKGLVAGAVVSGVLAAGGVVSMAIFGTAAQDKKQLLDECQADYSQCPLDEEKDIATVNMQNCMGCGVCVDTCPAGAISLKTEPSKGQPLDIEVLARRMGLE